MTKLYPKKKESQSRPPQLAPAARVSEGPERGKGVAGDPSCLYSNNSIGTPRNDNERQKIDGITALSEFLSPYHKRAAHTLYSNVDRLVKLAPSIGHVAFLTLTFPDNVTAHEEAYNRFRSFNTNFLAPSSDFGEWVNTKERQGRGAWHYHMIVHVNGDILEGFDFDVYEKWLDQRRLGDRVPTGNQYLRKLWHHLYEAVEKYGFGLIFSLEPIRTTSEGLARYVGKYISKHLDNREDRDKGVRLVNYSRGWSKNSVRFAWYNHNTVLWRDKVAKFAAYQGCTEFYQLSDKLGPDWAYKYANDIMEIENILEENDGLCQPEYKNCTIERSKERRKRHLHQKQKAKDQERFLEWESEQKYKQARSLKKVQARNIVQSSIVNTDTSGLDFQARTEAIMSSFCGRYENRLNALKKEMAQSLRSPRKSKQGWSVLVKKSIRPNEIEVITGLQNYLTTRDNKKPKEVPF